MFNSYITKQNFTTTYKSSYRAAHGVFREASHKRPENRPVHINIFMFKNIFL